MIISRIVFGIMFLLNLLLITAGSSGAVPFGMPRFSLISVFHIHLSTITGTMLLIALLWFGISAPLSAIGSYFGSKHGVRDINHDVVIASAQQRNFRHSEIP